MYLWHSKYHCWINFPWLTVFKSVITSNTFTVPTCSKNDCAAFKWQRFANHSLPYSYHSKQQNQSQRPSQNSSHWFCSVVLVQLLVWEKLSALSLKEGQRMCEGVLLLWLYNVMECQSHGKPINHCVCVFRCNILPGDSVDEKHSGHHVAVERCNVSFQT